MHIDNKSIKSDVPVDIKANNNTVVQYWYLDDIDRIHSIADWNELTQLSKWGDCASQIGGRAMESQFDTYIQENDRSYWIS